MTVPFPETTVPFFPEKGLCVSESYWSLHVSERLKTVLKPENGTKFHEIYQAGRFHSQANGFLETVYVKPNRCCPAPLYVPGLYSYL